MAPARGTVSILISVTGATKEPFVSAVTFRGSEAVDLVREGHGGSVVVQEDAVEVGGHLALDGRVLVELLAGIVGGPDGVEGLGDRRVVESRVVEGDA